MNNPKLVLQKFTLGECEILNEVINKFAIININPLTTIVPYNIETSQLICNENQ